MIATIEKIEFLDAQEMLEVLQAVHKNLDSYQDREICLQIYDTLEDIKRYLEYEYNIGIPESEDSEFCPYFKTNSDLEFDF